MHQVDRAAGGRGGGDEQRAECDAEANLLAPPCCPWRIDPSSEVQRVARLSGIDNRGTDDEGQHHRQQHPTLSDVAHDVPEGERKCEGDYLRDQICRPGASERQRGGIGPCYGAKPDTSHGRAPRITMRRTTKRHASGARDGNIARTGGRAVTLAGRPGQDLTPSPPGGSDVVARVLADGLHRRYGEAWFVENRPGADGVSRLRPSS